MAKKRGEYHHRVSRLTEQMKQVCLYEVEHPDLSYAEIARELNMSYSTIWDWKESESYQDFRDKLLRQIWRESVKVASKTMRKLAQEGDREASKYILSSIGYDAPQKLEVKSDTIKINIGNVEEEDN